MNPDPSVSERAVLAIVPRRKAVHLLVRCPSCASVYAHVLPTVGGLPVGECRCPDCTCAWILTPEAMRRVVDRHWPAESADDVAVRTREAVARARVWATMLDVQAALRYEGVDLAEGWVAGALPHFLWERHRVAEHNDA
jgi:hypothetical protein